MVDRGSPCQGPLLRDHVTTLREAQHVAIIGDLHGQLFNLLAYLLNIQTVHKDKGFRRLEGSSLLFCDPQIQYVFMGDYVDRGERGVELLLLLLAYKAGVLKLVSDGQ